MKTALFLALGALVYRVGLPTLDRISGMGKRMPLTLAALAAAGISLVGVPLTVGFNSKWYLLSATLDHQWWWLAAALLTSSLISVAYVWRVVEAAYFRPPLSSTAEVEDAPASLLIPIWILVFMNYWFGINGDGIIAVAHSAANVLIEITP